jgi:hypothetical protein
VLDDRDAFEPELAGILITDDQVDWIYDAAHIGQTLEAVTAWRNADISSESAREQLARINHDCPMIGERASAEAHRITDLIHAEVYGQGERDGTE